MFADAKHIAGGAGFLGVANAYALSYRATGNPFFLVAGEFSLKAFKDITPLLRPRIPGCGWALRQLGFMDFVRSFRGYNLHIFQNGYVIDRAVRELGPTDPWIVAKYGSELAQLVAQSHDPDMRDNRAFREKLYRALVRWEQETVLGDVVAQKAKLLAWPLRVMVRHQPLSQLGYFGFFDRFFFRDFFRWQEREEKSIRAYLIAERMGLENVEAHLFGEIERARTWLRLRRIDEEFFGSNEAAIGDGD